LIGLRQILSTNENLAIFIDSDFHPREYFPDRSSARAKRMVEAYQRSGLGHSVSLNDRKAQPIPKCLGGARQCGPPGEQGPEFPAQTRVNAAESPPAPKEMLALSKRKTLVELLDSSVAFQPFQFPSQRLNESRDRNQDGYALTPNRVDQVG